MLCDWACAVLEFVCQDSRCTISRRPLPGRGKWLFVWTMLDLIELEEKLGEFLTENSFGLVDFQVTGSGRGRTFRLFVERADGSPVDLNDCAKLSPRVKLFLESNLVFNDDSSLLVSSPGVDRLLKRDVDFERYAGSDVTVSLRIEGRKLTLAGELAACNSESLELRTGGLPPQFDGEMGVKANGGVVSLPRRLIKAVRLRVEG